MNPRIKILLSSLVLLVALAVSLFYNKEQHDQLSKRNYFIANVETEVNRSCDFFQLRYKQKAERLEKLKSDSCKTEIKNYSYQRLLDNGETSWAGVEFFNKIVVIKFGTNNAQELTKSLEDYLIKTSMVNIFISNRKNFNDLQKGEIDTLISYYKNLAAITEKVKTIKIEL